MIEQEIKTCKTIRTAQTKINVKSALLVLLIVFLMQSTIALATDKEKVVLQLRWNNQFQFAGYYVAKWFGYYEEEGLDVDIRSAFCDASKILYAPKEVSEGRADFGIGSVDILIAQNNGADLSVIASLFQRSPVEYYMKSGTPYNSIVDLTALNTARRKNDLLDIELKAMLISEGINPFNSKLMDDTEEFSVDDLITGKFDVIPGYLGTIAYYAEKRGVEIKTVKPIDYGIDFYGDTLFTRKSLTRKNPELVEKFRRASLRGWEYALEHPEEIAEKIGKEFGIEEKSQEDLIEFNKFQAEKVLGLTLYPVVEIGNINPYRWSKMQETLLKLELVTSKIDSSDFIFDYEKISNEKVERIEKYFMTTIVLGFVVLIIFFIVHLTAKNTILQNEITENKRKEALIIHQARLAAMGEMIANIAHQWRQPLNNLGLVLSNIEDAYLFNELDCDFFNDSTEKCRKLILKMSDTIDDFRYFLNPKSEKKKFSIYKDILAVLDLVEENLRFHDINVIFEETTPVQAYGYANQYSQAIFNIINNSIDALTTTKDKTKEIRISIYEENNMVVTEFKDNGGGIDEDILEKVFDVYFTTKKKSNGTGLGLYITKMIIENNMGGEIDLVNIPSGVCMRTVIPKHGGEENATS